MAQFDVFLSYHWRDHAQVEALAQRLRSSGLHVFLDRWYLTPGTNWLKALETTLANCQAVAVCIGAEMGTWQLREQYSALERQAAAERNGALFPVIPVLLPGSEPPLGFLRQNTWIDLRPQLDDPTCFAALTKAIRGEPPGPDLRPAVEQALAQVCPYRGLLYFREEDAEFFFGREASTHSSPQPSNSIVSWPWSAPPARASLRWRAPGSSRRCAGANRRYGRSSPSFPAIGRCMRWPLRSCPCWKRT